MSVVLFEAAMKVFRIIPPAFDCTEALGLSAFDHDVNCEDLIARCALDMLNENESSRVSSF